MNELISIIVPIYNTEKFLKRCIESIISQSYPFLEIILINDGSTDNSEKICNYYKNIDKRIIVISIRNQGSVVARNIGIKRTTGNYIAFVDSDDWIDQNFIRNLYEGITKTNSDIAICDFWFTNDIVKKPSSQIVKKNYCDKKELIKNIYPYMIVSGSKNGRNIYSVLWNKLFKVNLIKKNIFYQNSNITIGDDLILLIPILLDSNRIIFLDKEYLYYHQVHNQQMTLNCNDKYFSNSILLCNNLLKINENKATYDISSAVYQLFVRDSLKSIFYIINNKSILEKDKILGIKKICDSFLLEKSLKYVNYKYESSKSILLIILVKFKLIRLMYFLLKKK